MPTKKSINSFNSKPENSKENLYHVSTKPEIESEMQKYNISCVSVQSYHYKNFRYSNLDDAISQAKRDEKINKID
jgi:flagellar biosynthesis chaperone FliJ